MIGDKITPDSRHVGSIAMVRTDWPGRTQLAGRLVELQSIKSRPDGRQVFVCRLFNDASPHGDRYPVNPEVVADWLELCNISDSLHDRSGDLYCYNHGTHQDPYGKQTWHLPTPPKFKTQAEADEWMAKHEEQVRVRSAIGALKDEFERGTVSQQALQQTMVEYVDKFGTKHCPPSGAYDPDVTPVFTTLAPPEPDLPF